MGKELKNKPLAEAIFEVKWKLQGIPPAPSIDPHYKLLLGRFFDRMQNEYPVHEPLPAANVPDELVGHLVQHRFRKALDSWPLVQIGPGILTVNSTEEYTWSDFRDRILYAMEKLYDAHPKVDDLKIASLILRYIDSVEFDYVNKDVLQFLEDKLKLKIRLPDNLFTGTGVEKNPSNLNWRCSFRCQDPKGTVNLLFATGKKRDVPAVVWETTVESVGDVLTRAPKAFENWLASAHKITDDWFFKMIEGELERNFV